MKNLLIKILALILVFSQTTSILTACKLDLFGNNDNNSGGNTHVHRYTKEEKEPTCIRQGYTLYTCTCGEEYKDDYVKSLGHNFKNYVSDNNATCTENSTKTAKCTRCNETDYVYDEGTKLGHNFKYYVSNNDATYEKDGTKTAICERDGCGKSNTVVDVGSKLIRAGVSFKSLTVNGTTVSGVVDNDVTEFNFSNEISINGEASYVLYYDYERLNAVVGTTLSLKEGDNVVYLLEIVGEENTLYTITIRRAIAYTVSFDTGFTDIVIDNQKVVEGGFAFEPNALEKEGYTFICWDYDFTTPITSNVTIFAVWTAGDNIVYKVNYYFENVENDEYTINTLETEYLTGKTGELGYAEIKSFTGFTAESNEVYGVINGDGSTILNVYYQRNEYEVVFYGNSGTLVSGLEYQIVKYQGYATVPNYEKQGYYLSGWGYDFNTPITDNLYVYAIWASNGNTPYKVEYYLENLEDNNYTLLDSETEYLTGTTDAEAFAEIKSFTGFTVENQNVKGIINGDGSTVLKVYYQRNEYDLCVTQTNYNGGVVIGYTNGLYKYGTVIAVNVLPSVGYTFNGWEVNGSLVSNSVSYSFEILENVEIVANLQLVEYNVNYELFGGENSEYNPITYNTETPAITLYEPTRVGYTFDGWYTEETYVNRVNEIPLGSVGDKVFYAKWIVVNNNAPYKVEYYLENLENEEYTLTETVDMQGEANTMAYAEIKNFTGFTAEASEVSGNINGNGETVLKVYYQRNEYNVTFDGNGGSITGTGKYKYGKQVTLIATPYLGYDFGWYNGEELLNDSLTYTVIIDKNITAKFDIKPEMKIFNFTSTATTCSISGVKDKTATEIIVPNYVTSIGSFAFFGCSSLTNVIIGNSVTSIGSGAFSDCDSLTSIEIPNSVTSIGGEAFSDCDSLTSIEIPNSVTSIGGGAFAWCDSLTSIEIPNSVTSIGDSTFYNCDSLTSIEIPNSVISISSRAFYGCPIETANIPTIAISYIPKTYLKTLIINGGDSIGANAFKGCSNLKTVTISENVTTVDSTAFANCKIVTATVPTWAISVIPKAYLETLNIVGGEVIASGSCYYYSKLTTVTIGDSVKSIGENSFVGSPVYTNGDYDEYGVLYIDNWLMKAPTTISGNYVVREGTVGVAAKAFYNCLSLTGVTLPDSLKSVDENAFAYCYKITSVTLGSGLENIGNQAFNACNKITTFKFNGTTSEWESISKGTSWNGYFIISEVTCSNGTTSL